MPIVSDDIPIREAKSLIEFINAVNNVFKPDPPIVFPDQGAAAQMRNVALAQVTVESDEKGNSVYKAEGLLTFKPFNFSSDTTAKVTIKFVGPSLT